MQVEPSFKSNNNKQSKSTRRERMSGWNAKPESETLSRVLPAYSREEWPKWTVCEQSVGVDWPGLTQSRVSKVLVRRVLKQGVNERKESKYYKQTSGPILQGCPFHIRQVKNAPGPRPAVPSAASGSSWIRSIFKCNFGLARNEEEKREESWIFIYVAKNASGSVTLPCDLWHRGHW